MEVKKIEEFLDSYATLQKPSNDKYFYNNSIPTINGEHFIDFMRLDGYVIK